MPPFLHGGGALPVAFFIAWNFSGSFSKDLAL